MTAVPWDVYHVLKEYFADIVVAPVYEEEMTGLFYNTAAVLDSDGAYLGKYRKTHLTHLLLGFWEKFYFRPGNLGYPAFDSKPIPRWGVHFGILKTAVRTRRLVISPLVANRVGTDSAILRYVHFTLALV